MRVFTVCLHFAHKKLFFAKRLVSRVKKHSFVKSVDWKSGKLETHGLIDSVATHLSFYCFTTVSAVIVFGLGALFLLFFSIVLSKGIKTYSRTQGADNIVE